MWNQYRRWLDWYCAGGQLGWGCLIESWLENWPSLKMGFWRHLKSCRVALEWQILLFYATLSVLSIANNKPGVRWKERVQVAWHGGPIVGWAGVSIDAGRNSIHSTHYWLAKRSEANREWNKLQPRASPCLAALVFVPVDWDVSKWSVSKLAMTAYSKVTIGFCVVGTE